MLNQIIILGRLSSTPQIRELENGKKECIITLAVNRTYRNEDGVYETDLIPCLIEGSMALNTCEYYTQGDLLGIRGKLECNNNNSLIVVADRITYLSNTFRDLESESEE